MQNQKPSIEPFWFVGKTIKSVNEVIFHFTDGTSTTLEADFFGQLSLPPAVFSKYLGVKYIYHFTIKHRQYNQTIE